MGKKEDKMKQKTADKLIEKLEITHKMAPLLASFKERYKKFKRKVGKILEELQGTRPRIITGKKFYNRGMPYFGLDTNGINRYQELPRKNIFCLFLIGTKRLDFSLEILSVEKTSDHNQEVIHRANFVLEVLKQQHKEDIWQGGCW